MATRANSWEKKADEVRKILYGLSGFRGMWYDPCEKDVCAHVQVSPAEVRAKEFRKRIAGLKVAALLQKCLPESRRGKGGGEFLFVIRDFDDAQRVRKLLLESAELWRQIDTYLGTLDLRVARARIQRLRGIAIPTGGVLEIPTHCMFDPDARARATETPGRNVRRSARKR